MATQSDLLKQFLAAIAELDKDFPTSLTGKCRSALQCDDDGEFLCFTLWLDDFGYGYAVDSQERTWKFVEHAGLVEQYIWHQPTNGEPQWTRTYIRPPFDVGSN